MKTGSSFCHAHFKFGGWVGLPICLPLPRYLPQVIAMESFTSPLLVALSFFYLRFCPYSKGVPVEVKDRPCDSSNQRAMCSCTCCMEDGVTLCTLCCCCLQAVQQHPWNLHYQLNIEIPPPGDPGVHMHGRCKPQRQTCADSVHKLQYALVCLLALPVYCTA